ncbi:MAG: hypothetical protein GY716_15900 [bacterium]|nr:hypothetical protein [bacterium]
MKQLAALAAEQLLHLATTENDRVAPLVEEVRQDWRLCASTVAYLYKVATTEPENTYAADRLIAELTA